MRAIDDRAMDLAAENTQLPAALLRFIVGETPAQAEKALRSLWREGVGASVDLLGEATVSAAEADA